MLIATSIQTALFLASILTRIVLVVRLRQLQLHRVYPWFFGYWILSTLRALALMPHDPQSREYYRIWLVTEPPLWAGQIALVLELHSKFLDRYRGIYRISARLLWVGTLVAIAFGLLFQTAPMGSTRWAMEWFLVADRTVRIGCATYVVLLLAYLNWLPVPVTQNTLRHAGIFSAYYGITSAIYLIRTAGGSDYNSITSSLVVVTAGVACLAWTLALTRQGEESHVNFHHLSAASEERLLRQLDTLNARVLTGRLPR